MKVRQRYSLPSLVHYVLCFFSLSDILVHEGYSLHIIISKSLYVVVKFLFFRSCIHIYWTMTGPNYLQELNSKKNLVSQCIFIILVIKEYWINKIIKK